MILADTYQQLTNQVAMLQTAVSTTTTSTQATNCYVITPFANATGATTASSLTQYYNSLPSLSPLTQDLRLRLGVERVVHLPDGSRIKVDANGSFTIEDQDARITYQANRVRPFNRYVNASDLLEDFIRFCGSETNVRKPEMLDLPLKLFIGWLVLEAAKADEEPAPPIAVLPDLRKAAAPQCRSCGRFIPLVHRRKGVEVCGVDCFEQLMAA